MNNQLIGQALALTTALCWAMNSMTYNILGKSVNTTSLAHFRSYFAVPLVFILMLFTEGLDILSISKQSLIMLFLSGLTGYYITDVLIFHSYVYLGAREALVIMTFSPVFSAFLSIIFLHEILSIKEWLGIIIIILGIIMMVLDELVQNRKRESRKYIIIGIICAILGAIFQAISYLFAKFSLNDIGPVSTNFLRNLSGLICFMVFGILRHKEFKSDISYFKNKKPLLYLLIAVVTGPVLGMSFQMLALNLAPVGVVTALSQISPLFMLPFDRIIFKKRISRKSIFGTIISIAGTLILFF